MTAILAIDPGTTRSAWVWTLPEEGVVHGLEGNEDVLALLNEMADNTFGDGFPVVVIEQVESYGMAVGAEVFETVFWSGRFAEAARPLPVHRIGRKAVKLHLCGTTQAKDANIRAALIDRFGGKDAIRKGGPLYGIHGDEWAALAVAVTWADLHPEVADAA
jgi:hypothetical protein